MKNEILLLFPPFTSRENPYLSIPVLAKYLKSRGIPVSAEDIGIKFWNKFMSAESTIKDIIFDMESRFHKLNNKNELSFREIVEYIRITRLLNIISNFNDFNFPKNLLLSVIMTPYFPNFYTENPANKLFSPFDEFSSNDILKSIDYDFFYSSIIDELIKETLENKKPLIAAISLIFQNQVLPTFYIASLVKKYSPETHVTIGGPFLTLHFNKLKNKKIFKIVDSLILDEGEIPLESLYYELQKPKPLLSEIPNLIWCNGKKIIKNKPASPLPMDKLICPDYGIMPLDQYQTTRDKMIYSFRLSRGCYWQQCSFCRTDASFCKNYAQPDYESVFNALLEAYELYGAKRFLFSDESAHPKLLEFLSKKIIENKLDISWLTHTRFHSFLTKEQFKLFKKANCEYLTLGLESYNDRLLKLMKKGINVELIDKVINGNNGIVPLRVYMIVGFPTETEEEALKGFFVLDKMKRDNKIIDYIYSFFQLNFGSDMWYNYKNYGIKKININSNQDLLPDIYDFDCEGMDRKTASDFYLNFSQKTKLVKLDTIKINNKEIKINYNIDKLVKMVREESFYSTIYPFEYWLNNTKGKVSKHEN